MCWLTTGGLHLVPVLLLVLVVVRVLLLNDWAILQVLKAPVARLRVLVNGFCRSPCEIKTGTEIRFTALLSSAYGDNNTITEYS